MAWNLPLKSRDKPREIPLPTQESTILVNSEIYTWHSSKIKMHQNGVISFLCSKKGQKMGMKNLGAGYTVKSTHES